MLKPRGNLNYLGFLIQQYVKKVNCFSIPPEERKKLEHELLIELFSAYGFSYSSDGEIDMF